MEESTAHEAKAREHLASPRPRPTSTPAQVGYSRVGMDARTFKRSVVDHVLFTCARSLPDAAAADIYRAMAHAVRDRLVHRWLATQRTYEEHDTKRVYYLSSEFLTGRSLGLCLLNMGLYDAAAAMAAEHGFDLGDVLDQEGDPGLGNGGLGRLAACFMDSLATLALPAVGYGIRYDFGIFEQRIENGAQVERHDNWLVGGNPWELSRIEDALIVKLGGTVETRTDVDGRLRVDWKAARTILGVPFDSFIIGHKADNVNTLRLWAARATRELDLKYFNDGNFQRAVEEKIESENISKVLYPDDHTEDGKSLRLKQQYFFVACSIGDIVRNYKRRHRTFDLFSKRAAIQLNDTHPSIAIAELMRILVDEENMDWEPAWAITEATFGYTNHTLMPEALEKWPVPMFERLLPRHLQIICEINQRFLRRVQTRWPTDVSRLSRMSIIEESQPKQVRMAHLAAVGSHSINGVANLHTQLLQRSVLADFHQLLPERFNNKTNGVSPRRWVLYSNPALTRLVSSRLGSEWIDRDLLKLQQIASYARDVPFLEALSAVKLSNKQALATLVQRRLGIELPPDAMFVVQIKRIHEYKRQLLTCLHIIAHYLRLKSNPGLDAVPRAYVFAGKAAAAYTMAKLHIRLLNDVAAVINGDPEMQGRLAVAFIPNYGVTLAQTIIPAADLSVQISTAGTEASGTSNMKFALNGALTIGTLDGANVELREAVGPDNFFLFGLRAEEVARKRREGYDPRAFIERSPGLREALAMIEAGFFSFGEPERFRPILDSLRWEDRYMVCADFEGFAAAEAAAAAVYRDPLEWSRRAVLNVAGASGFSADETIRRYSEEIWGLQPVHVDPGLLAREP
jgi:starch phosphorylase